MGERFLLVGGGGRESAFALKLSEEVSVSAFLTHANPGIVGCAVRTGGKVGIGDVRDSEAVARFAREADVDYAFVSADDPLANGVVDALLAAGIKTVGATREAARIEWDKVYAIRLVEEVAPDATPAYEVVETSKQLPDALERFRAAGQEVVVKPQGLTGGKGVKVMPEHLPTYEDALSYAEELLERCPGEHVLLAEKLHGVEFTIMGLTDGHTLVMSPASYDYPFRFEGDVGPGTGGMGCFTAAERKLPFLTDADMRECESIMRRTICRMAKDGRRFNGVLNAGFFKTKEGIRFMEFNSRFGDPEGLNVLTILKSSFAQLLRDMEGGEMSDASAQFVDRASVVKYLVARDYPGASTRSSVFEVDLEGLRSEGVNIFFGACEQQRPVLYRTVGSSRVLALGATADEIHVASERVNKAVDRYVRGPLDFRRDIGSKAEIERLCAKAGVRREIQGRGRS